MPCIGLIDFTSLPSVADYVPDLVELTFDAVQDIAQQCGNISIVDDTILELNETFFVLLNSTTQDVEFNRTVSSVLIIDNDSKYPEISSYIRGHLNHLHLLIKSVYNN